MSCKQCDELRLRVGTKHLVGQPCDICNDTGVDFIGRPRRHCDKEKE